MINIEELIKASINKLWIANKDKEYCTLPPYSVAKVPTEGILFIGINPSLSEKEEKRLLQSKDRNCEFHELLYDKEKEHRYFRKFFDISEQTNLNWGHLDLLYIRETNQKKIEEISKTDHGKEFIFQQCMITKSVLDKLIDEKNPRIFVVNNSLARNLLGEQHTETPNKKSNHHIGYDFVWDEKLGTHTYKNNPFFFTSMLTGQRALDNGSFQRLVWHINQVKKQLGISNTNLF